MKRYPRIVLALASLLLLEGAATADADTLLKTSIPFAFTAGNSTLPPGAYHVGRAGGSLGILQVRGSKKAVFLTSHDAMTEETTDGARMVFHRYGDRFFLREVWVSGRGYPIHDTTAEREWAKARESGAEPRPVRLFILKVREPQ